MGAPHIVADITAHGYGHLVQSALVLNALRALIPDLRLTIRCGHGREVLEGFIKPPFEFGASPPDFGMKMLGPSRIDAAASLTGYQEIFAEWEACVAGEADALSVLDADLHFSNIGFVGVAAAARLGTASIGLCSLNWLDIFNGYCREMAGAAEISDKLFEAYSHLECFIRPTPSMSMSQFSRFEDVAPIARVRKDADDGRLSVVKDRCAGRKIAVASMGGIPADAGCDMLPEVDGLTWIAPKGAPSYRRDILDCETLGVSFFEAFCVADVVLTKTGYGTFAEAVCNGVRLLYADRPDWPEASALERWADENGCTAVCSQEEVYAGRFVEKLQALLEQQPNQPIEPTGAQEAAQIIAGHL